MFWSVLVDKTCTQTVSRVLPGSLYFFLYRLYSIDYRLYRGKRVLRHFYGKQFLSYDREAFLLGKGY